MLLNEPTVGPAERDTVISDPCVHGTAITVRVYLYTAMGKPSIQEWQDGESNPILYLTLGVCYRAGCGVVAKKPRHPAVDPKAGG